jgi:excisionase family DNA binding protein
MIMRTIELPSAETVRAAQIEPLFYDINEAAQALNVSTKSIRRLLRVRKLTSCKALRKVLIPRKQIEEFAKASCDTPTLTLHSR